MSKIFEFTHIGVFALDEAPECILPNDDISDGSREVMIWFPRDITEHSGIASVNKFTIAMRLNLAQSLGLGTEEILPNREDLSIRGTSLRYYTSLTTKLLVKFGIEFHLCPVYGDGNSLYRALSHIIFG